MTRHTPCSSPQPEPSLRSATPFTAPVTARQLIETLQEVLPGGKFSEMQARGALDFPPQPYVHLVFDDGNGPGAISVSLNRVVPGSGRTHPMTDCPDKALFPHDSCFSTRLPDGSLLKLFQGYGHPERRDLKLWTADLVTPTGQHISVSEWNATAEKDAPISRSEPPLTMAQLEGLVTAQVWRRYVDSIPEDGQTPRIERERAEPAFEVVLDTLVRLLPASVEIVCRSNDHSYLIVDDGEGRSFVQLDVQHNMGSIADDLFVFETETLADGTKVSQRQDGGDKDVAGCARWAVDTLRTDGFRVAVSEVFSAM
ncbi:hypothetical protein ACWCQP_49035 [Streptomyces chartreusis]